MDCFDEFIEKGRNGNVHLNRLQVYLIERELLSVKRKRLYYHILACYSGAVCGHLCVRVFTFCQLLLAAVGRLGQTF